MARPLAVAAAQMGPVQRDDSRQSVVARLIALMREAHARGCRLVVYPELALTTFFPRRHREAEDDPEQWFERRMPDAATRPLFEEAARLGVGFYLGYAELAAEGGETRYYNSAVLVDGRGAVIGKFRKVHLPGHRELMPEYEYQYSEKSWFSHGNLGFPTFAGFGGTMGMCICNDRRFPETFRVLGLRGAELVMLGFNTPVSVPWIREPLTEFHSQLCMQAGAYQNGYYVIGVGKTGREEVDYLMGGSCIVSPRGEIVALVERRGEDALAVATIDLDEATTGREHTFNLALHRQPQAYGPIVEQAGIEKPESR